jgi:hypothetical protein
MIPYECLDRTNPRDYAMRTIGETRDKGRSLFSPVSVLSVAVVDRPLGAASWRVREDWMLVYIFTLEVDVLDEGRLVEFARGLAAAAECDPEVVDGPAAALRWIFDDNSRLAEAGYPAEIVCSSCGAIESVS